MNSTPTTSYLPLTSHSEIRLLLLKPGSRCNPIECSLIHTEIGKIPYEALSYEWGTQQPNEPTIYISDNPHEIRDDSHESKTSVPRQIRHNLYDALSRIRLHDEIRWLWVDALCINQADNRERTHQVGIMGRIYESARMVIAWLGEGYEEDVRMMRYIQTKYQQSKRPRWSKRLNPPKPREAQATIEWCEKSYWNRVWIVQELILARNLILVVGSESVAEDIFFSTVDEVVALNVWENTVTFRLLNARHPPTASEFTPGGLRGKKLCDWIFKCRESVCMDPRDHVYGLLGISEDVVVLEEGQLAVEVDYEKSVLVLYYDVARFWMAQYGWSIWDGHLGPVLENIFGLSHGEVVSAEDMFAESYSIGKRVYENNLVKKKKPPLWKTFE